MRMGFPWDSHGNGNDIVFLMGMGMGVGIWMTGMGMIQFCIPNISSFAVSAALIVCTERIACRSRTSLSSGSVNSLLFLHSNMRA